MKSWLRFSLFLAVSFGVAILILKNIPRGTSFDSVTVSTGDDVSLDGSSAQMTDWKTLRGLDLKTGALTSELGALDGKVIRIPGFMVPLDDNQSEVTEFLLVPTAGACIHVPPPPPNQMIYVRMQADAHTKVSWGPIWLEGKLKIASSDSPYGKVGFEVAGISTRPFSLKRPLDEARPPSHPPR